MGVPAEYNEPLHSLADRLARLDQLWADAVEHAAWAGRVLTSVLLLVGEAEPELVLGGASEDGSDLTAYICAGPLLITVHATGATGDAPDVRVTAQPLVLESLEVSASADPWAPDRGARAPWPGDVTATAHFRGTDPVRVPGRAITSPEIREQARVDIAALVARLT